MWGVGAAGQAVLACPWPLNDSCERQKPLQSGNFNTTVRKTSLSEMALKFPLSFGSRYIYMLYIYIYICGYPSLCSLASALCLLPGWPVRGFRYKLSSMPVTALDRSVRILLLCLSAVDLRFSFQRRLPTCGPGIEPTHLFQSSSLRLHAT